MPDGQRFYSFDYLNGVGLWPGTSQKLYYQEKFLLYDATADQLGTTLIGYVWQTVKVSTINVFCSNQKWATSCSCPTNAVWDSATYDCVPLVCNQAEYATGVFLGNSCECINGYLFSPIFHKCVIDCGKIDHALPIRPDIYQCYCADNWAWNSETRRCEFDCMQVPYSNGNALGSKCECLPGFNWDDQYNECVCPQFMVPSGGFCVCINDYYPDVSGNCLANCSLIFNAVGETGKPTECFCSPGYYFAVRNGAAGCQLNCSSIADTNQ
jgi:hypothetical protein